MNIEDIDYEMLFSSMVIKPEWQDRLRNIVIRIRLKKSNYEIAVSRINPKMPWYFVAIIHYMECNLNFNCQFHNGDSLRQRTIHAPAGRPHADPINGKGKPYTWIESVVDAMQLAGFEKEDIWSLKDMLFRFNEYNGFGYEHYHNMLSPYLWSGTNHYEKGKYDADGHFNPELVSTQVGAAPLLRYLTDKTLSII